MSWKISSCMSDNKYSSKKRQHRNAKSVWVDISASLHDLHFYHLTERFLGFGVPKPFSGEQLGMESERKGR